MLVLAFLPEIVLFLLLVIAPMQAVPFGPVLVLAQMGMAGLLLMRYTRAFLDVVTRWWWLLLLPALAIMSAFWSEVPELSVRYGAQSMFTIIFAIALARLIPPQRYIEIIVLALFVFSILGLLSGRVGPSATGPVLIGLTGSKNAMAFTSLPFLYGALALLLSSDTTKLMRWIAFAAIPFALFLIFQAKSATANVLAVAGMGFLLLMWLSQRVTPAVRTASVLWGLAVLAPITALTPEIQQAVTSFITEDLGKDMTLTGRTLLWERADALIEQKPVAGHGYRAIWMGDSTESIALRRITGIEDGRTFNFHNTYRQIGVDLGFLGIGVLLIALLVPLLMGIRQLFLTPNSAMTFFVLVQLTALAGSFTEVNYYGTFSAQTYLQGAAWVYAFWGASTLKQQQALRWPLWARPPAHQQGEIAPSGAGGVQLPQAR